MGVPFLTHDIDENFTLVPPPANLNLQLIDADLARGELIGVIPMQLAPMGSFSAILSSARPFTLKECWQIIKQWLNTLNAMHNLKVVHLDIKPDSNRCRH